VNTSRGARIAGLGGLAGLMLACAGWMDDGPSTEAGKHMNAVIDDGRLKNMKDARSPFSSADFDRWGLAGTWTWHVAGEDQELKFSMEGDELVAKGAYGTFRGGEHEGLLVLKEYIDGPGPPMTTWVNLAPVQDGELVAGIQAGGDMDQPSGTSVLRVGP